MIDVVDFVRSSLHRFSLLSFAAAMAVVSIPACADDASKPNGDSTTTNIPQTARAETVSSVTSNEIPKPKIDEKHPLYLPLEEAYKAREALKAVKDYEAIFTKRELMGRRLITTTMNLKVRQEPFSVYLKFLDINEGREVIYVQGHNNNQLFVHEKTGLGALAGTMSLLPTSGTAMSGNKYPVTMIGLQTLLDRTIAQWEAEGKFDEVITQKYPDAKLPTGESCIAYESSHPRPRDQFKFKITRLWIDKATNLAIRVEQIGFPQRNDKEPPIVEEYTYSKLKTNVKLTDRDFDIRNPAYGFPEGANGRPSP